jgi:hypothetical protein
MRLCYNCQYMDFDTGEPDWSEVTPGSNGHMECYKGHWQIQFKSSWDMRSDGSSILRECLETANHCEDYEHSVKAKELGIPDEGGLSV